MSETPTGPGWYEDPDDPQLLRYYDGIVWTSHTNPRRSPTADQSTIGRAAPVPPAQQHPHGAPGSSGPPWSPPQGGWQQPMPGNPYGSGPGYRTDVLPDGAVLAEWWRRLLARMLDWVLSSVLGLLVALPWLGEAVRVMERYLQEVTSTTAGTQPDFTALSNDLAAAILPLSFISLAVSLVYEVGFLAWKSATPGKMVLGTVVRRVGDGEDLGFTTAMRRQVVMLAASALALVPIVGLLGSVLRIIDPAWLLWDAKRQTLHDKVADTVVVLKG